MCHPCGDVCTHAGSGPSRVRRRRVLVALPWGPHLPGHHFVSDPGPRNDQRPAGNIFANKDTSVELAIHSKSLSLILHMMSLNIDMKIIRPWNCSGSPILFMNFWTSWTSCIPLGFYRFSVNCVQSSVL